VRQYTYFSKPIGHQRQIDIYTPPGYDQQTDVKYPVLFLQHGSGDNQSTWTAHGRAHWILDNLIAQGKARPMLVVMANGHATGPGENTPGGLNNSQLFEKDLIEEVIPYVESHYRVLPAPQNRAIVGLSMGGEQSLRIGLTHRELFAWIGGFSAAAPQAGALGSSLDNADLVNQQLKLLWIACGKDDFLLSRNQEFITLLKNKNIRHDWHLTEGNHSWPVWRDYLAQIVPLLFQ
jgi:enterochelin esterase family protein